MDRRYYNALAYDDPHNAMVLWPYEDRPSRSAYNRNTIIGSQRNIVGPEAGYSGTQSGEVARGPDGLSLQEYVDPRQIGALGTQSGKADESFSAGVERNIQGVTSALAVPIGLGMSSSGNVALGIPMTTYGAFGYQNAVNAEIQDVWAHKLMQYFRRKARGLE